MAVMRPGSAPFDNLTTMLLSEAALGRERQTAIQAAALLQATLRRGPLGLVEAVAESQLPEGTNCSWSLTSLKSSSGIGHSRKTSMTRMPS